MSLEFLYFTDMHSVLSGICSSGLSWYAWSLSIIFITIESLEVAFTEGVQIICRRSLFHNKISGGEGSQGCF